MLKSIVQWFAFQICELQRHIRRAGQNHYANLYPYVDRQAVLGPYVKFIGPKNHIVIGAKTYINDAIMTAGENCKIEIGENCSIGYRVSIKAVTHDISKPCADETGHIKIIEKDIKIGNNCWIGDNVFIREGIVIGDNTIVGANSVVTKSLPAGVIAGGVPCKIIKERAVS